MGPEIDEEIKSVPNLVTQRCLDVLGLLLPTSYRYFLTAPENPDLPPKNQRSGRKGKEKEKLNLQPIPAVTLMKLLERPAFLGNSSTLEQLMHLLSNILRPLAAVAKKKFAVIDRDEAKGPFINLDISSSDIKLPQISSGVVQNVVNVLKDGTCSLKTFQNTLQVILHLCSYPENRTCIVGYLLTLSQEVANGMREELGHLVAQLKQVSNSNDMDSNILSAYTAPSAEQAKLLRLLKTIDYVFRQTLENQKSEMHAKLKELYDKLDINPLWKKLSECMSIIDKKEGLIHVATVLLPLIESFMVVAKPYVHPKKGMVKQHSAADLTEDKFSFFSFTEEHKKILNTMVRNNPSLMNGSFSLLVENPKVLEFDNKRTYFNQQLHKKQSRDYGSLQINVRRQYVFEDSYHQLLGRNGDEIKYSKLNVRFHEEEGVDAGGVAREWFSVLARQMFNPDYALFRPSAADKVTYQPNRASGINPDHLSYLKFVGRIIGKAIYDGRLLDAYFTRSFYKCILGIPVDYKDIEAIDPEFHKSLEWILQNDITDILDLTMSVEVDDFGRTKVVDLCPDGRNIVVTEENKVEYVRLVTEQRLVLAIKDQIGAFLSGFHDVIPRELIKIFNEQELELLISGMPDIDIDDWKNNTEYTNYTSSSPQIQWFWRAVRSFSQEERAKLIQFATGTSKVPLEGFAQLQGSTGVQKFQIHKEFSSTSRLPSAHTW